MSETPPERREAGKGGNLLTRKALGVNWQPCDLIVRSRCGCAFICLQRATRGHNHAGPFIERCQAHE